jgi:hypothetical protein
MNTTSKTKTLYWVVCGQYRRGPFSTREVADRALDDIELAGHCSLIHHIEETNV